MEMSKLTVRLPTKDIGFAKEYAKKHGISLTELIDRYFQNLQSPLHAPIYLEIQKIKGIIPNINLKFMSN